MPTSGNTVRLKAEFKTYEDEYADPTDPVLKIYNKDKVQVGSTIELTEEHHTDTGIYEYDYTIPALDTLITNLPTALINSTKLYYEFSGTLEDDVVLGRGKIIVEWVN